MKGDWETRSLYEVADQCLGKMLDKTKNRGTPRLYLRNLNVRWFDFNLSDLLEMRFEDHELERYTAKKGDLIVCEGGYPGRAAIWPYNEPVYLQKALHRVRFKEPERAKWFLYLLYLSDMNGSLRNHFTGTGIQHFTGEALRRFRLPLPPFGEQQRIVAFLDEAFEGISAVVANAEKNLANARDLLGRHMDFIFTQRGEGWVEKRLGDIGKTQYGLSEKMNADKVGYKIFRMGEVQSGRLIDAGEMKYADITPGEFSKYKLRSGDVLFNRTKCPSGITLSV